MNRTHLEVLLLLVGIAVYFGLAPGSPRNSLGRRSAIPYEGLAQSITEVMPPSFDFPSTPGASVAINGIRLGMTRREVEAAIGEGPYPKPYAPRFGLSFDTQGLVNEVSGDRLEYGGHELVQPVQYSELYAVLGDHLQVEYERDTCIHAYGRYPYVEHKLLVRIPDSLGPGYFRLDPEWPEFTLDKRAQPRRFDPNRFQP